MTTATAAPLLSARGLGRHYGGVRALTGLDLVLSPGEHAAVVGDNGAGKSTFVRMISGAERPDDGHIEFGGQRCHFRSPLDARSAGIETVYQDLSLADDLDVVDNLFLGRELFHLKLAGLSVLNRRAMRRRAEELLDEVGVNIPSLSGKIRGMSGGQRQGVAIARAAGWGSKLIILDEPTAALGVRQTAQVLALIKRLREQGHAVIVISHNLADVFEVADRIFVLRLGREAGDFPAGKTNQDQVVAAITGASGNGAQGGQR
jgi:ABC-type sugar transport system ATPase subunit